MSSHLQNHVNDSQRFFDSPLFNDVQLSNLFKDSKTFADVEFRCDIDTLLGAYNGLQVRSPASLKTFISQYCYLPAEPNLDVEHDTLSRSQYVKQLWKLLTRPADSMRADSLLPLPHPYLVPGGRFREIYYWDSYFSALGLIQDGHSALVRNMIDNFIALQQGYGIIPNGNRSYYLGRSQPPVLMLLMDLDANSSASDPERFHSDTDALETEYRFWMQGQSHLQHAGGEHRRLVRLDDGSFLNRYWDDHSGPRPESYREDIHAAKGMLSAQQDAFFTDIRAACESGWDFSSRWLKDPSSLTSIRTTRLLPVDLNCLLYGLETRLAERFAKLGQETRAAHYEKTAETRAGAIRRLMWNEKAGLFCDYDIDRQGTSTSATLATVLPLYAGVATPDQAAQVSETLMDKFLVENGLLTSTQQTCQQWDAPNGWAPLHWFAVQGLKRYGQNVLANQIATRWVKTVDSYYATHGRLMEKYNLALKDEAASGGEYDVQHGFGWTNGVTQVLSEELQRKIFSINP